jgi:hypothetical protein
LSSFLVAFDANTNAAVTFTIRKNGVSQTMICTIASGAKSCSTTANPVTFAAGDLISIEFAGNSGSNNKRVTWSGKFN